MGQLLLVVILSSLLMGYGSCVKRLDRDIKIRDLKEMYGIEVKTNKFTLGKCKMSLRELSIDDSFISEMSIRKLDKCNRK